MMGDIKLFVTDLDGTLLSEDHDTVSERNQNALRELKKQGVKLCACTGRLLGMMPTDFEKCGFDYVITSNGACCKDLHNGETVFEHYMSVESARFAWELLGKEECMVEWFVGGEVLMDEKNWAQWKSLVQASWHWTYFGQGRGLHVKDVTDFFDQGAPKLEKISIMSCPLEIRERAIEPMLATGSFEISTSLGYNYEITDIAADKGSAIRDLCAHLGYDTQSVICFGDGGNDVKMFDVAGVSVAMANGHPNVKNRAKYETDENTEDGVALFLEKHILKP